MVKKKQRLERVKLNRSLNPETEKERTALKAPIERAFTIGHSNYILSILLTKQEHITGE